MTERITLKGNEAVEQARKHEEGLRRYIRRFGVDDDTLDDMMQEVYLKVFRAPDGYDSLKGASFRTWLFEISKRYVFSQLRRTKRKGRICSNIDLDSIEDSTDEERDLDAERRRELLRHALDRLSSGQKGAIILRYLGNGKLSYREISDIIGVSYPGGVKMALSRGLARMRELLPDYKNL